MPTRPQKAEKRTSGSAKLCAVMAAPLRQTDGRRTGCRSAHCRARRPIRGRSAPRWRDRRLPLAETPGRRQGAPKGARPAAAALLGAPPPPPLPPGLPASLTSLRKGGTQPDTSRSVKTPLCYKVHTDTRRLLPAQSLAGPTFPPYAAVGGRGGRISAASGPSAAAPPGGLCLRQVT